ncbi:MAG: amino acid ABC transporter substrate-binding protein [Casimicrobiaceae bacterium]
MRSTLLAPLCSNLHAALGVLAVVLLALPASTHADTLSKIRTSGEFLLGHREASVPFSFIAENGQAAGYTVDICLRVVDEIKRELKRPDIKVRFVPLKPADRIAAVKEGRVDVECGSTTNTAARQKDVDFSFTIFVAGARLMARKSSGFKDLQDLRGKRVGVTEKTTTEAVLRRTNQERNLQMTIVTAKDHGEGFALLQRGEVDAIANDDAMLLGLALRAPKPDDFEFVGRFLSVEPYGIMLRKNDAAFARVVDRALLGLFESGEIFRIYAKWFESGAIRLPMNQYMRENVRLPNKYGVQ